MHIVADVNLNAPAQGAINLMLFVGTPASLLYLWVKGFPKPERQVQPDDLAGTLFGILLLIFGLWAFAASLLLRAFSAQGEQVRNILANLGATIIAVIAAVLLNQRLRPKGIRSLGLNLDHFPRDFASGVIGIILVLPWVLWCNVGVEKAIAYFHYQVPMEHELFTIWSGAAGKSVLFRVTAVISAVLIAPIAEEIVFRGMIQTMLLRMFNGWRREPREALSASQGNVLDYYRPDEIKPAPTRRHLWAVVITSLLFAGVHQPWPIIPSIFILSLGLGLAYERRGNLWANITMHALFNTFNFFVFLNSTQ